MVILGISNSSHDSSAAILKDGVIIAATEEEKFNRIKHSGVFPVNSIKFCLKKASVKINDIDEICFSTNLLKKAKSVFDFNFSLDNVEKSMLSIKKTKYYTEKRFNEEKFIRKKLGYLGKISFFDHHDCHAAASYFSSGFKDATILSVDGVGETSSTVIYKAEGNKIKKVLEFDFPNSLGALYSITTAHLGYKIDSDEGKVMGLAPYGSNVLVKEFNKILKVDKNGLYCLKEDWIDFSKNCFSSDFIELIGSQRKDGEKIRKNHKDIAFAVQKVLEDSLMGLVRLAKEKTSSNFLCLGGGVALNSIANGKIAEKKIFDDIFIYPASGDSGLSVGAAQYAFNLKQKKRIFIKDNQSPYLGYESSEKEIIGNLKRYNLKYIKPNNLEFEVAKLLADNKIVGWFSGRTEFGPRALGSRSILADPRDYKNKDKININVKNRESFRPFAPVIIEDLADKYFCMNGFKSPYMILAFKVRKNKKKLIPAVVHIDNTARIQTINKEQHNRYFSVLNEFYKITGVPVLLNTSFNMAGEVIVNRPEEAIETFNKSGLDVLVLEDFLVLK